MASLSSELRLRLGDAPAVRLDKALAAAVPEGSGLSRSALARLITEGAVSRPDGTVLGDPRMRVWPGEELVLRLDPPRPDRAAPEAIPLAIVFEDAHLIVVDKPAGMVVHPAPGAASGTLVNALLAHCGGSLSGIGGVARPGIVHRIDKDTSGLLVAAKTDAAHQGLAAQFAAHTVLRRYLALCRGAPDAGDPRLAGLPGTGFEPGGILRIEGNIDRHGGDRKRMAVVRGGGKAAVTRARVCERFGAGPRPVAALVECRLETGRTHQIRVHLAHVGHPLVGDQVYGRARPVAAGALGPEAETALQTFPRQALHAAALGFVHPATGETLDFEAPLPPDLAELLTALRRSSETETFNKP